MSRAAVMGFGVTGRAVASYLAGRGEEVLVLDDHAGAELREEAQAIGVRLEATPEEHSVLVRLLAGCELVVASPGVPVGHPVFAAANEAAVPVVSEIELAAEALPPGGPQLVAVTGTNGKTTVTTLVTAILNGAGMPAVAAGNIGLPLIEAVQGDSRVVVAEVSSFQLQFTHRFRPRVSCWLNLAPDHLDWHPTIEHYGEAKARIWARQSGGDAAVVNADDDAVMRWSKTIPTGVRPITFSVAAEADFSYHDGWLVGPDGGFMPSGELPRSLPHDIANSLAAAAVAGAVGTAPEHWRAALASVEPLPHRVALVGTADGVSWYDDSKATTPASVLAAVAGFRSVVLIAGGRNKGLDLSVLASAVPPVRAAVAIGEAAGEVESALGELVPVRTAASMSEAVELAESLSQVGDVVLLSPGCASFDWYRSYAARGDDFAAEVRSRMDKGGTRS